jgi:hypothetical protein
LEKKGKILCMVKPLVTEIPPLGLFSPFNNEGSLFVPLKEIANSGKEIFMVTH